MRQELRAERDEAIALLQRAAAAVTVVQPEALRAPLRHFFAATIEQARGHKSLLGRPLVYALEMARAILDEPAVETVAEAGAVSAPLSGDIAVCVPRVGDVVHYVSEGSPVLPDGSQKYPSRCRAAIVAEVYPPTPPVLLSGGEMSDGEPQLLALTVFSPTGSMWVDSAQDEHDLGGGSWHWPEGR